MRRAKVFSVFLFIVQYTVMSQQLGKESFAYEVNKSQVYMFEVDEEKNELDNLQPPKLAKQFQFFKVGELVKEDSTTKVKTTYFKFQLVPFSRNIKISESEAKKWCEEQKHSKKYACRVFTYIENKRDKSTVSNNINTNDPEFEFFVDESGNNLETVKETKDYIIDRKDSEKTFAIESRQFDMHLQGNTIVKKYPMNWRLAYGPSFSVPFKFRRPVNEEPLRIEPSFQLGGFFGAKFRVHKYSPVFVVPMATLGVTSISLNESNVMDSAEEENQVPDGQILARTISLGLVAQIDKFQIGFVLGWDKPGGDIGKDWVYSDRPWYSFQIGFDFLNLESGKSKEKDKE